MIRHFEGFSNALAFYPLQNILKFEASVDILFKIKIGVE